MSDSLLALGERTLAAAAEIALSALGEGVAEAVAGSVEPADDAFAGVELPAVVTEVPFAGGASGTFVLVLTQAGALRTAALLGAIDEEAAEYGGATLDATALTALGQLAHRIAVAAADERMSDGLPPRGSARIAEDDADVRRAAGAGTSAVRATINVLGEPALLVQVVPAAALLRLDHAADGPAVPTVTDVPLGAALHDIDVRVWAELGRTQMPTGEVVGLPGGAIVELDREAEDAVDLYVDGQLYATGRLVVTDDDSWGVRVERVLGLR